MMQNEKVESLLLSKGFKREGRISIDPDYVVANYFRVLYGVADIPHCISNEKPPQLHVAEDCTAVHGQPYRSFSIQIRNKAPYGWAILEFYGLSEAEFIQKYDDLEKGLIAAWRALFEESKANVS